MRGQAPAFHADDPGSNPGWMLRLLLSALSAAVLRKKGKPLVPSLSGIERRLFKVLTSHYSIANSPNLHDPFWCTDPAGIMKVGRYDTPSRWKAGQTADTHYGRLSPRGRCCLLDIPFNPKRALQRQITDIGFIVPISWNCIVLLKE